MNTREFSPSPKLPSNETSFSFFSIRTTGSSFSQGTLRLILQLLISHYDIQRYTLEKEKMTLVITKLPRKQTRQIEQIIDYIRYKLLTSVDEFALLEEIRRKMLVGEPHVE